ncbi:MAG TPA: S8 family serine peptidase, partial [bacterium]|nr:S8 family serine peptidase [bacterium]
PLLASRIEVLPPGTMESVETCNGEDDDGDGDIDEACSHGTFVAGEVAIVAPGATIIPCRALNSDGVGSVLDVLRAMFHLAEQDCDVINLSLSLSAYHEQFEGILAGLQSRGIAVVAAAGNAGGRNPLFPGTSPYAVGAAAVDVTNTLASFSGGGPLINLGAPGVGVRSAFLGGGTGQASGTSMAAPIISGTIALVIDHEQMSPLDAVDRVLTNAGDIIPWTASESGAVDPMASLMSTL